MTPLWAFLSQYEYERGSLLDGVRVINRWPYKGDCDDMAWTVLVIMEGSTDGALKALDDGRAEIWRVWSPQNKLLPRHVSLWTEKKGWICSTSRNWRVRCAPNKKAYKITKAALFAGTAWGTTIGQVFS